MSINHSHDDLWHVFTTYTNKKFEDQNIKTDVYKC